jgi:hypothetical protein
MSISESAEDENDVLPEGQLLRLNDWQETGAWGLAVLAGAAGLFLLLVPSLRHHHYHGPLRELVGVAWLGIGLFLAGMARSGMLVDSEGIILQGVIKRSRWKWSEVIGFHLKTPFYKPALRIQLADGSEASSIGFSAKSAEERNLAEARVAELNRRASAS